MDLSSLMYVVQVVLGIGLVIFVHEAGHFLCARWCGVRVDVFSLGFGPPLLSWKRGHTVYQVAAVPLGGFVKMHGEETYGDDSPPEPDELRAKSVGQRFLIYSGGVLMNVLFALIVFPILLTVGVPFVEPVIGEALSGGPAWHARIEPGTRVLSIDGQPVIGFMNIASKVALGSPEGVEVELLEPGADAPRTVHLTPTKRPGASFPSIDVYPATDPSGRLRVARDSAAWAAGLRNGDRLVGFESEWPELPLDRRLELSMQRFEPLHLSIEGEDGRTRDVVVPPGPYGEPEPKLGIQPRGNLVQDLRRGERVRALGLEVDDRLLEVNGREILRPHDLLDALVAGRGPTRATVRREGHVVELEGPALARDEALALADDVAVRLDVEGTAVLVTPDSPAYEAGLRDGDRVSHVDGVPVPDWRALQERARHAAERGETMAITVLRRDAEGELLTHDFEARPAPWALPAYGFALQESSYVYRAGSPAEAVRVGLRSSWEFLAEVWKTLKRMVQGRVDADNVGGIIMIARVSYDWAALGLAKLLFFLCMLSLNLAFINALPIPVLDGGHLFFLIVEKIKGSPVSERVLGYSQLIGVVLIITLMIFATYNDLVRILDP